MISIPQNIFTHVPNAIPIKILLTFEEKINIKLAIIKQPSSNGFSHIIKILPLPVGHGKEMRHHVEPARALRGLPDGNADRSCFPPNHGGKIIHVLPICRFPTLVVVVCFLLVPASSSLPPEIPHVWGLLYIGYCLTNILKFKGNAMLNNQSIRDQIRVVTGPGAEATVVEEVGGAMASPPIINSIQFIINSLSFIERGLNDLRVGYECQHHQNRQSHLPEQSSITRHRKVFVLYQDINLNLVVEYNHLPSNYPIHFFRNNPQTTSSIQPQHKARGFLIFLIFGIFNIFLEIFLGHCQFYQ